MSIAKIAMATCYPRGNESGRGTRGERQVNVNQEPVRNANAIALAVQGTVLALLTAAASLGWITINPEQMGAIEKALAAVLALAVLVVPPVVATFWARSKVVPVASLPPQIVAAVMDKREEVRQ